MYRQWRECTKAIIANRQPKFKKHQKITEAYLHFARKRLVENPDLAKAYNNNHGIIKMRDDFLASQGLKGSDIIYQEMESGGKAVADNVVLVPVATIGCGKTTVALALCKLFGWGHIQNDNITKKPKPQNFARAITDGLTAHPVMIADRNNHQRRERKQIIDDVSRVVPDVKFVALQYVHDRSDYDQIRAATRDRVLSRGDNHQTIQAGSKGQDEIISIMEGFMHRFEPVDSERDPDDSFDHIINLDVRASSRENLELVVEQLSSEYPHLLDKLPTGDDLDRAIEAALSDYKPDIKHEIGGSKRDHKKNQKQQQQREQKPAKVEYFGVDLQVNSINAILEDLFQHLKRGKSGTWNHLKDSRRVQHEFHVTLIHRAHSQSEPEYWEQLSRLHAEAAERAGISEPEIGSCSVQLERLIWDNRLMCFVVRLSGETDGVRWRSVNPIAHITVGTVDPSVKPVESNNLLQKWEKGGSGQDQGIWEERLGGHVELPGKVRGVLQRR